MKNNYTPSIRLAGFTQDWEQRTLGEISEKVIEKNKENTYSETFTNSAEFGIVSQLDYFDKDISNEKNLDSYYIVRPNDFVYNPRISKFAPVGPIKRNKLGRIGVMSPLYYVFRTQGVDEDYLETYFSSSSWHLFMKLNGDSGARADRFAIKDSLFREMTIPFPLIQEQTKIGEFFKQLDEFITLHQQELTILKQTKQGFLQKMFPKKGEAVPEVRFPGFTGDWKERRLGELVVIRSGWSPSDFGESKESDGELYVKVDDLNYSQRVQIDSKMKVMLHEKYAMMKKGSIIFPKRGAAIMTNKIRILGSDSYMDTNMMALETNVTNVDFLYTFIARTGLFKIADTSTIPQINNKHIESYRISLPAEKEQIKIGNFFKQLDEVIALHEQELQALQQTKKAFLQKMFV